MPLKNLELVCTIGQIARNERASARMGGKGGAWRGRKELTQPVLHPRATDPAVLPTLCQLHCVGFVECKVYCVGVSIEVLPSACTGSYYENNHSTAASPSSQRGAL